MENKLYTLEETQNLINTGKLLVIAGADSLLSQLPDGNWIGGSNPYLLDNDGGKQTHELLYVKDFSEIAKEYKVEIYDEKNIENITTDAYDNGIILTIIPAFTPVFFEFALKAPSMKNQFINPLIGWVSGTDFDKLGTNPITVYNGNKKYTDKAVTLQMQLPENKIGRVEILNVYEQGDGDEIIFEEDGYNNTECIVNGKKMNMYEYMSDKNYLLPLVANYSGASINVGLIENKEEQKVIFAAPVYKGVKYKFSKPIGTNYNEMFFNKLKEDKENIDYSYSCLYNYFNFQLEGKEIPGFTGVFTYGEIAYQLMNITFVYLIIEDK